jgi:hypothetical protein
LATSAAVYVAMPAPRREPATCAARPARGIRPSSSRAAPRALVAPKPVRIQDPTLIGDVTLNTRSMYRNRSGRPRSETSSAGLTTAPPRAPNAARRASASLPCRLAASDSGSEAPARPPVKKYQGISDFQIGGLMTDCP